MRVGLLLFSCWYVPLMWTASRLQNIALNAALLLTGLGVAVLLYSQQTQPTNPPNNPDRADSQSELVGTTIQVEVRNGVGEAGIAAQTMHYLRSEGFDVVEVGNHTGFGVEYTMVIDRIGDMESARRVAEAIGVSAEHVHQEIRKDLYLDASIIVGHDYDALAPFDDEIP